jgi:hypothetical protein
VYVRKKKSFEKWLYIVWPGRGYGLDAILLKVVKRRKNEMLLVRLLMIRTVTELSS